MKKILLGLNILFLGIIIFQGCTTSMNAAISNDNKTTFQNYATTPFIGLSNNLIKTMVQEYYNASAYQNYHPTGDNVDSRSIWFNLDTLKKFIWYVETTSKANGLNNMNKLGVRFYYGRYPEQSTWSLYPEMATVPTQFEKLHTAFLIPTYFNTTTNYNVDFDPNYMTSGNPNDIKTLLNGKQRTLLTTLRTMGEPDASGDMRQNHGDLIPPMSAPIYRGADIMEASDIP